VSILVASLVFVPVLFAFIWVGVKLPLDLVGLGLCATPEAAQRLWLLVLLVYVAVASILPVWLLLQPRDYLNSYLLYVMVAAGFAGIVVAGPTLSMPAFIGWSSVDPKGVVGSVFPILYVTVACGACSGFHALVSSGTTAKQLDSEKHILPVGYGSMLVEGVVAIMALISVAILSRDGYNTMLQEGTAVSAFASGLASFTLRLGLKASVGITFFALAISAFMLTTLDTATRLTRFTWQELFLPAQRTATGAPLHGFRRVLSNPVVATLVAVLTAGSLAMSGSVWDIWPVFGASNQLLAALTLLVVTLFLVRIRANFWVALIPMLFMGSITVWALVQLIAKNVGPDGKLALVIATGLLLILALGLAVTSVWSLRRPQPAT
jgi:carbon starvation protein